MSLFTWNAVTPSWTKVLNNSLNFGSYYKVVPTEGYLAWEYNPLRNYRLNNHKYEKDGKYYNYDELEDLLKQFDPYFSFYFPTFPSAEMNYFNNLIDDFNKLHPNDPVDNLDGTDVGKLIPENYRKIIFNQNVLDEFKLYTLKEPGELVDFITEQLSFDLNHPVEILPQPSYDGSVNLILNDGLNIPRLINSRFTVTGRNTYKVIDRKGDNDTNIYDEGSQFDVDSSLFKIVNKIPELKYLGTTQGNMPIGNYHFYFKYADADGNESDWVAESGLVSVFMGVDPQSVNTGIRDENSLKGVKFSLSNIDIGYQYVKIYYTRYTADVDSNLVVQAKKIDKNFLVNTSGVCNIYITGDENLTDVTLEDINSSFEVIQTAQTQCSASNRLFMAHVHKSKIEYDLLSKLSLCFCPYKVEKSYDLSGNINCDYHINAKSNGYYDSQYIYDNTGYWPGELYRLGVVYILKDGSLSPVFNIRGATNIPVKKSIPTNATPDQYEQYYDYRVDKDFNSYIKDGSNYVEQYSLAQVLEHIDYSEENYLLVGGAAENENAKGVIQLSETYNTAVSPFPVYGIQIDADSKVIEELQNYVKGFFFVRQKRIPLTLAQGICIGLDNNSRTPTLPAYQDVITTIETDKSFVETSDLNFVNYVSEGFLSRYYYDLKVKPSERWKLFGKIIATIIVIAAAIVVSVFTCGAGAAAGGAAIAATVTAFGFVGAAAVAAVTGVVAAVAVAATVVIYAATEAGYAIKHSLQSNAVKEIKGRNEEIPDGYERVETEASRQVAHDLQSRYIISEPDKNKDEAFIVPDYQVNGPYYNQLFTGGEFTLKPTLEQPATSYLNIGYFDSQERHFYVSQYNLYEQAQSDVVRLVGVPDGCPVKMIGEKCYKARAGYPEEAYKYAFVREEFEDSQNKRDNSDIIRGNFGSFVGVSDYKGHACDQVNIMIPGYQDNKLFEYVKLRAQDTSAFYAISDRIDINASRSDYSLLQQNTNQVNDFSGVYYRGDCYICQYTHRIVRNFNDPSAPYNDVIVDPNSWKDNYDPDKPENYANINLGDVNAVQLGLWLTFQLRSSYNLNIRTVDKSHVDEYLMCGNHRSFYPHYGQLALGSQKIPDSDQYNKGFSKSVSEKYYFEVPDIPYIKQEFQNRIVFSDIHINDAYKNGFRVLRTMNHKDYPMIYGSITKILEVANQLFVVFEHGVGLITINNSAEHSSQVLSDVTMLNDMYGSQWKDSVIKTPRGIYGVDTVAKKIWRVREGKFELISDFKVQEFLNQNITLSERELTPTLGIRNVKTLYNAFKQDVMFTFYDNLYGFHEKAWTLCWNEVLEVFTTFYSWIPSEMQNIDNIPFSFDRDTVKAVSKIGVSDHGNDFSDGVTLSNNVLDVSYQGFSVPNDPPKITYYDKQGNLNEHKFKNYYTEMSDPDFVGFLYLDNRVLPDKKTDYSVQYELLRDDQGNHKLFTIKQVTLTLDGAGVNELLKSEPTTQITVNYLAVDRTKVTELLSEIYYRNNRGSASPDDIKNKIAPVNGIIQLGKPIFKDKTGKRLMLEDGLQINPDKIIRYLNVKATVKINPQGFTQESYYDQFYTADGNLIDAGYFESQVAITTKHNLTLLSTDFWKHGQAGLIDIADKIYPTYWYGKQHPFEFECVIADDPSVHKIFTNLELVANKAKPESFHYEVVGDVYDFADDKPNMYFRQEALKALYQYNGYDIEYNPNFLEVQPVQHNRSADLPKYYSRWDTINDIYDSYKRFSAPMGFDYDHLSGAEVVYYPTRNEFRIWNHVKAVDVDSKVLDRNGMLIETSILKANCRYLEDKWLVSVNPIIVTYKNEFDKNAAMADGKSMFYQENIGVYKYSNWVKSKDDPKVLLPPINITGTKLEQKVGKGNIEIPENGVGKDNALYDLYDLTEWKKGSWSPIDPVKNTDRRETDVRGKFMKVRIRYSGEELAIIDFLNTIYQISYA